MLEPVVVLGVARTPIGSLGGGLSGLGAPELGAHAIKAALGRAGVAADEVDEVLMGCVLQAGVGQSPARQAAIGAGIPVAAATATINKVCGSGMKTVMLAADALQLGHCQVAVAGGMESMSRAPYLLQRARDGYRFGHGSLRDAMLLDGLEDAYSHKAMGVYAEQCVGKYQFGRQQLDDFALASLERARAAADDGAFADEIAPMVVRTRKGEVVVERDEQPQRARPEKIPQLKPAFVPDGKVTAANSSSISDGAAALVLMRRDEAMRRKAAPLAVIRGYCQSAREPEWFTIAPVDAMRQLLDALHWTVADVDLFEINEAFAAVTMAAMHELDIPHDKVNVHGGACALGHPIGCSGARLLCTLACALRKRGLRRGIASLCIGGGEAVAMALELDGMEP